MRSSIQSIDAGESRAHDDLKEHVVRWTHDVLEEHAVTAGAASRTDSECVIIIIDFFFIINISNNRI